MHMRKPAFLLKYLDLNAAPDPLLPYPPECTGAAACVFTSQGPCLCSRNVTRKGLEPARPVCMKREQD